MNQDFRVTVTAQPEPEDAAFVRRQLYEYNLAHTGSDQHQALGVFLWDERGRLAGGLLGDTYWGWLYISIFWLREDVRGQGCGSRLLSEAEAEAVRRGCRHVHVDTLDFQAPEFYLRRGYTQWGILEDLPPDHRRIFLRKDL